MTDRANPYKDRGKAVERTIGIADGLCEALPRDGEHAPFFPGMLVMGLFLYISDYGWDWNDEQMEGIIREAIPRSAAPDEIIEPLIALWHDSLTKAINVMSDFH